jgi:pyruvate-ferredoxin/flavodoxin oxidoreductase
MRDLTRFAAAGKRVPKKDLALQYRAVASGYWPLVRYDPVTRAFLLDSPRPRLPLSAYTSQELRFRVLERTNPEAAARLAELAQQEVRQRWTTYEEMAARGPERFPAPDDTKSGGSA